MLIPNSNKSIKDIQKELGSLTCPPTLKVSKVRSSPIGVEVRGASPQDKEGLKSLLQSKITTARVEDKKTKQIRLIFHNATKINFQQFEDSLCLLGFQPSDIKRISTVPSKTTHYEHSIIELPLFLAQKTLLAHYSNSKPNFIQIGFDKFFFKIFLRIPRCDNCQALGHHPSSLCKHQTICMTCGSNHPSGLCTNPPKCFNCSSYNATITSDSTNSNHRSVSHCANDSQCPSYKAAIQQKLNNYLHHIIRAT